MSQKLKETGFKIDDKWIGSLLLAGPPERFSPTIMIKHSGIAITSDSIKSKLIDVEPIVDNTGSTGGAFASRSGGSTVKTTKKRVKCFRYKQLGHYKNKCPNNAQLSEKTKSAISTASSAVFLNGKFFRTDWYIVSGASAHLTANKG